MKPITILITILLLALPALAVERVDPPVLERDNFLLTDIEELNVDYALV